MSSGSGLRIQWIPKSPTSYTEPSVRYHVHCRNPPCRVYRSCVGIFPHQEKVQAEDTPQPARPSAYITLARYVAPIRLGNAAPHLPRTLTGVAREMYSPLSMPYRMKVFTSYGRAIRIPVLFGVRTVYGSMYPRLMPNIQDSVIAVSDPLAIATLLNGKDASSFDLPGFFTECVVPDAMLLSRR